MKPRTEASLRNIHQGPNSFHLDVELRDDGAVVFAAQDLGPVTALVVSGGDYEYWRSISAEHVPALVVLAGGERGDDVIELLSCWSGPASFELEALLRDAPFPVEFFAF